MDYLVDREEEIDFFFLIPQVQNLKKKVTFYFFLFRKIPWAEEPGGLQSTGSQRVGHDLATKQT